MTGRGRGRGRGLQAAKPGVPGGRGSGLQTQSPAATPAAPTETPAVSTETPAPASASLGRGRVRSSAQSSASPSASPSLSLGRGRALLAEKRSASSVPPPGLGSGGEDGQRRSESAEGAVSRSESSEGSVKRSESSGSTGISLESMLMALPEIPRYKRPARGSEGREIALQSNLFKVALKGGTWYKYDVEILTKENEKQELVGASEAKLKDKIQSRHLNRVVIDELFRRHTAVFGDHWPAYDGRKTLICAKKFFHDHMFTLSLEKNERGGNKHFAVNLRFIMEVDVTQVQAFYNQQQCPLSLEVIQAGNIIIDSALGRAFVAVNRSYYASTRSPMTNPSLTGGKELRSGVYTSLRFTEWGPLLLVDKSNTAFYKGGDLIQYIGDFLNDKERRFLRNGFRREQLLLLSRDLKRLTVKLKHSQRGRCVRINGLSEYPASQIEFTRGENEKTTVAKYFNERYADYVGTLKYPNLPCVIVVRGAKTDYYPLEVCELKQDQPYRRKLNPMQTAMMIRNCQEKPSDRIAKSIENVKTVKETGRHVLRQHGVEIDEKPVQTVGRQIDPPHVLVKGDKISVVNGVWKQQYFHEGAELSQWCVVDCADVGPLANRLADLIYSVARKMQLTNVAKAIKVIPGSTMNLHDIFKTLCKMHTDKKKPMLAVFILGTSPVMYSQIKLLSEIKRDFGPIITQCVKGENITHPKKFSEMFVSNVMKKINVKLGGINNVIHKSSMPTRFSNEPFIVIGADVNHAAPGDFLTPSIAAVVGSIDYVPSKYYTEIRVQTNENNNRIEYIKDLKDIAVELLKAHRRSTDRIPEHIYYIRDGVSEGQFEAVRRFEINALRQACKSLASDYQPSMTVLIAQKRHHVRFNVLDPRQAAGKAGNVPPGTYIDRDVVHPEMFDLYMYTHQGLLGTSRPTHYHLIHSDDKSIGTDDITKIINHLCHVYARSSSAVSIPAPIYYAHHAAARAKEHIKGSMSLSGIDVQSVSSGGDNTTLDTAQFKASCIVHEEFRNVLYYA